METSKFKKKYLLINIPLMVLFLTSLLLPLVITDRWAIYYFGIAARTLLGIWCIFNGIWNAYTDYYSLLKLNMFQKNKRTPKWGWWLILILGIGCIITALMGFGFNNVKKPV